MVKLQLNLDEVGTAFRVIEPGRYKAKVVEIEETESQSGNPMLTWTWEIVEGDNAGTELRSYTSLQEHALFGLKNHLEAFGLTGEIDFDTDKLVGKTAMLVVIKQTIKNRKNDEDMEVNRIDQVLAAAKSSAPSTKPSVGGKGPVRKGAIPF